MKIRLLILALVLSGLPIFAAIYNPADCTANSPPPANDDSCYDKNLGQWLYYDASTTSWRCILEKTEKILNPFCPPYNAVANATDSTNRIAMQAVLDRAKDWRHVSGGRFWRIDMGEDVLRIDGPLFYNPAPNTSTLLVMFTERNGGMSFDGPGFTGVGDVGLDIGDGSTVGNVLSMRNLVLNGVGPESLVRFRSQNQVWLQGLRIGGFKKTGLYFTQGESGSGHINIDKMICAENSAHDDDGACVVLNGGVDVHITDNMMEGTIGTKLSHVKFVGSATVDNFVYTGNVKRSGDWYTLIQGGGETIFLSSVVIANNTGSGFEHSAINLGKNNGARTDRIIITGNTFGGCAPNCSLGLDRVVGILLTDPDNVIVSDNSLYGFDIGVRLIGSPRNTRVQNNIVENTRDVCVQVEHFTAGITVKDIDCGGAAIADVKFVNNGRDYGDNHIKGVVSTDGRPPIFEFGGLDHASDTVEYAAHTQNETCQDNASGTPGALTLLPSYRYIKITNLDPDGCMLTISEAYAGNGASFTAELVATVGSGSLILSPLPGVVEIGSGVTPYRVGLWDNFTLRYTGATVADRWVGMGFTKNSP